MIRRAAIDDRVREWGLREDVVEKDYVLGWILWGIGSEPALREYWVFKGGTCIKKCYIETYRFSEDLDFTVLPGGPLRIDQLVSLFEALGRRVGTESGIDFSVRPPLFRERPNGAVEGRIYYRGPLGSPTPASVKLDLTADETVVRPSVFRPILHPHEDELPLPAVVRCYGFEELFAEKIRALGERARPRDLYDVINLFHRADLQAEPGLIRTVLIEKCGTKGAPIPTYSSIESSPFRGELESEWSNMLAHQLPALPAFEQFWQELAAAFAWLEGTELRKEMPRIAYAAEDDRTWSPPPTAWVWGTGVPLEPVRFAGANHLCVELRYQGSVRVIEPYSLRRTREGNLLRYAVKADTEEIRSYRVDRIQGIQVLPRVFRPRFVVEFSAGGPPVARETNRPLSASGRRVGRQRALTGGIRYVIECPYCEKHFTRSRFDTSLRPHKDKSGWPCSGRHGYLIDTRY